ncbi:MAG: serine/threonine protein kinase [Planctomycetes bacterium]|nr:serine/threonine protein kinase [Planctomycetota bacterium]
MRYAYRHGDRPIEGYTVLRAIGRGAFGEVYYAVSDGGKEVALKALMADPETELRGARECVNLASPHLVAVLDIRRAEDGTWVLVLEHMRGPTLRQLLRSHPGGLGPERTALIAAQVAAGLQALHERGIVHRDLKPENVFCEDGPVKIGDYGLAKAMNGSSRGLATRGVGTVCYMAPEVATGVYGRGVDVYSFGVLLHELLTGSRPFVGDDLEVWAQHQTVRPALEGVPEPFRRVISRALEKDPRERYGSAKDLVDDLLAGRALAQSGGREDPLPAGSRAPGAALLAVAAAVLMAAVLTLLWQRPVVHPALTARFADPPPAPAAVAIGPEKIEPGFLWRVGGSALATLAREGLPKVLEELAGEIRQRDAHNSGTATGVALEDLAMRALTRLGEEAIPALREALAVEKARDRQDLAATLDKVLDLLEGLTSSSRPPRR